MFSRDVLIHRFPISTKSLLAYAKLQIWRQPSHCGHGEVLVSSTSRILPPVLGHSSMQSLSANILRQRVEIMGLGGSRHDPIAAAVSTR